MQACCRAAVEWYSGTATACLTRACRRCTAYLKEAPSHAIYISPSLATQVSGWRKQLDDKEKPETYVVSRYLESPLLIGSRKFDLRIYALVLSYVPLKVYLHRSGHGLICTRPSACACATGVAE